MLNRIINLLSGEFIQEPNKPLCIVYRIICNSKFTFSLKVGSCPNDDSFVQILFCPFLCSI